MKLLSPDEMLLAAKHYMLFGREPANKADWILIMNFFAANVLEQAAEACCKLCAKLYDMPLTDDEVVQIVQFQIKKKSERN